MFCSNCGAQNADGTAFCKNCGTRLSAASTTPPPPVTPNPYSQPQPQFNGGATPLPNLNGTQMGITERSIGVAILLSIITCGIYGIYWFICITEDTNKISGEPNPTSGGIAFLLCIITCNIYTWFWMYKRGEYIDKYHQSRGLPSNSSGVLYLILAIFGFSIISYALIQNELNKVARGL